MHQKLFWQSIMVPKVAYESSGYLVDRPSDIFKEALI
jgi:hypothetical protein